MQDTDALSGDADDGGEFFERRHDQVVGITFLALAPFVDGCDSEQKRPMEIHIGAEVLVDTLDTPRSPW